MRFIIDESCLHYELCALSWQGMESDLSISLLRKYLNNIKYGDINVSTFYKYINYGSGCSFDLTEGLLYINTEADEIAVQLSEDFINELSDYQKGLQVYRTFCAILIGFIDLALVIAFIIALRKKEKLKKTVENIWNLLKKAAVVVKAGKHMGKMSLTILLFIIYISAVIMEGQTNAFIKTSVETYNREKREDKERVPFSDEEILINIPEAALSVNALELYFWFMNEENTEDTIDILIYKDGEKIDTQSIYVNDVIELQAVKVNLDINDLKASYSFRVSANKNNEKPSLALEGDSEGNISYGISYEHYNISTILTFVIIAVFIVFCLQFVKANRFYEDKRVSVGVLIFSVVIPIEMVELMLGNYALKLSYFCSNVIIGFSVFCFLLLVMKSCKKSVIVYNILMFLYGSISYFVLQIRGIPFLPQDIKSIGVASSVISNYTLKVDSYYLLGVIMLLCNLYIVKRCMNNMRIGRTLAGAVFSILMIYLYSGLLLDMFNITVNSWSQKQGFKQYGHLASFYANIISSRIIKPQNYTKEGVEEILNQYTEERNQGINENINIIVIMNEAFSDLSVISDFQTNKEVMPYFKSLMDTAILGNMYVSIVGGNTCNTEFEFLTGNTMGFLPDNSVAFQNYIEEPMDSIASELKAYGYKTIALHPYFGGGWNRSKVYPLLGMDEFYDISSFPENVEYIRSYISDSSNYDKVLEIVENEEEPLFLFNVTMQNHGGYSLNYRNFKNDIQLVGLQGDYPQTEQYLSLLRKTDDALKAFCQKILKSDEKTIICFFGDHQPFIERGFLDELYGKEEDERNISDLQKRYCIPYAVIANYDLDKDEFPENISANYLGIKLLKAVNGGNLIGYYKFLDELCEIYPVINVNGYMDKDGNWFSWDEKDIENELLLYHQIEYGIMFDDVLKEEGRE